MCGWVCAYVCGWMGVLMCPCLGVSVSIVVVLLSFLHSVQIELSDGRVFPNEREFLVKPHLGLAFAVRGVTPVLTSGSSTDISGQSWLSFGKKPFDWLSDNQWKQLLVSGNVHKMPSAANGTRATIVHTNTTITCTSQ